MPSVKEERVTKLMAERGLCSRREAEGLIDVGQVLVDGVVLCGQGHKAPMDAEIEITQEGRAILGQRVTVMVNKPAGIVSTQPGRGQVPAWKLLRADRADGAVDPRVLRRILTAPSTLAVAGRLDRASRGLLVLTQDGAVARRIIGGHGIEKTYAVRTAEPVTERQIRKLQGRLRLDGRPLLPMVVQRQSRDVLRFVLVEGRKHQIRRVCAKVGLTVVDLFREAIGTVAIGSLREGRWRVVAADELAGLRKNGRMEGRIETPTFLETQKSREQR